MAKIVRCAVAALFLSSVSACSTRPIEPPTLREMLDRGQYRAARAAAEQRLRAKPLDTGARLARWQARFVLAKGSDAVKKEIAAEAARLVEGHPKNKAVLCAALRAYDATGIGEHRARALELLVKQFPDSPEVEYQAQRLLAGMLLNQDPKYLARNLQTLLDYFAQTRAIEAAAVFHIEYEFDQDPRQGGPAVARQWTGKYPKSVYIAAALTKILSRVGHADTLKTGARALELIETARREGEGDTEALNQAELVTVTALALAQLRAGAPKEASRWIERGRPLLGRFGRPHDTASARFFHDGEVGAYHAAAAQVAQAEGDRAAAFRQYARAALAGGGTGYWQRFAEEQMRTLRPEGDLLAAAREALDMKVPHFTDVTEQAGLAGYKSKDDRWSTFRGSFGDYDSDGDPDILLEGRILLRNDGGKFVDVTKQSGIDFPDGSGGLFADYDNDGDLDFYALSWDLDGGGERLYQNQGDGTFVDVTKAAGGIEGVQIVDGAAWSDYDRDGYLDLYVACSPWGHHSGHGWLPNRARDFLYRNRGDGTFEDVSEKAGFAEYLTRYASRTPLFADYDNDGDPDLYVTTYSGHPNRLWKNNGAGSFAEVGEALGVAGDRSQNGIMLEPFFGHSNGAAWGDIDNDGDLDLLSLSLAHPRDIDISDLPMLYRNPGEGGGAFERIGARAGLKYVESHAGATFADFDNDGDLDLFTTAYYPGRETQLYLNDGTGRFAEVGWLTGTRTYATWVAVTADIDGDGDLDLLVCGKNGARLLRNDTKGGHFLRVKLVGTHCNRSAIGARVTIRTDHGLQIREVEGGGSFGAHGERMVHFGLGTARKVKRVEVRFPCGRVAEVKEVEVDRVLEIAEP